MIKKLPGAARVTDFEKKLKREVHKVISFLSLAIAFIGIMNLSLKLNKNFDYWFSRRWIKF